MEELSPKAFSSSEASEAADLALHSASFSLPADLVHASPSSSFRHERDPLSTDSVTSRAYDLSFTFRGDGDEVTPSQVYDVSFIFGGDGLEVTPSGRSLPSQYVSTVRDVVSRLRESVQADEGDREARFRDKAEAAKEAIRSYLQQWRGKGVALDVDSALESALRELSSFYKRNGPTASLSGEARDAILKALDSAEAAL